MFAWAIKILLYHFQIERKGKSKNRFLIFQLISKSSAREKMSRNWNGFTFNMHFLWNYTSFFFWKTMSNVLLIVIPPSPQIKLPSSMMMHLNHLREWCGSKQITPNWVWHADHISYGIRLKRKFMFEPPQHTTVNILILCTICDTFSRCKCDMLPLIEFIYEVFAVAITTCQSSIGN